MKDQRKKILNAKCFAVMDHFTDTDTQDCTGRNRSVNIQYANCIALFLRSVNGLDSICFIGVSFVSTFVLFRFNEGAEECL